MATKSWFQWPNLEDETGFSVDAIYNILFPISFTNTVYTISTIFHRYDNTIDNHDVPAGCSYILSTIKLNSMTVTTDGCIFGFIMNQFLTIIIGI